MKKIISIFLSVVLLISVVSVGNISAYADSRVYDDNDADLAWGSSFSDGFVLNNDMDVTILVTALYDIRFMMTRYNMDGSYGSQVVYEDSIIGTSYRKNIRLLKGRYSFSAIDKKRRDSYNDRDPNYVHVAVYDKSVYADSITLDKQQIVLGYGAYTSYKVKDKINYIPNPSNAVFKKIVWSSSNNKVAKVDSNGNVEAAGLGTAVITANGDGSVAKCKVIVNQRDLYVYAGEKKAAPKVNGKNVKWKVAKKSKASIKKYKIKGKKQGSTKLTYKKNSVNYTVRLYVISYKKTYKKMKAKIKDSIPDPNSLRIYHIWRGYDDWGFPNVIIDYGYKNTYGAYDRKYYIGYYDKNSSHKLCFYSGPTSSKPQLAKEKKIK